METTFGQKLREFRQDKSLTLRALAEAAGVDFTYLSKIENDKVGYLPGAETIRDLAQALGVDAIELLELANKLPPELAALKDWDALLDLLESRKSARSPGGNKGGGK